MSTAPLTGRATTPERMDGNLDPATFAAVLRDLAAVNTVTRARPPTLAFVARALARARASRPLTILDVGFGDGDMLRAIARAFGPRVRLIGYDVNPRSAPAAAARTPAALAIDYRTGDAADHPAGEACDLIVGSLVAHHMTDGELVRFLAWMEARAAVGWFVNDLHRHVVARAGFRLLAAVARWHPIVRHDGQVSVTRGFVGADWDRLLAAAGIPRGAVRLRWHPPFRWGLGRLR